MEQERDGWSGPIAPNNAVFAVLSFEGPDGYSLAGGLGTRVAGLCEALAEGGFETHLYFVGDPALPAEEDWLEGRWHLHRWCQWISRYYPRGVYEGEEAKLYDFAETVPPHLVEHVAWPAVRSGRRLFVLAEEWHTAEALMRVSDLLHEAGLRRSATLVWNANNPMGFGRINWGRLSFVATLTTVSRYMKHYLWSLGQNPLVVPNGIALRHVAPVPSEEVRIARAALRGSRRGPAFLKVGRWDPDKRWLMAVSAVAVLKARGLPARLICKGGIEPHQGEVLAAARQQGLGVAEVDVPPGDIRRLAQALASAGEADLVNLKGFLDSGQLRVLYAAADAVLANSGMEPFGLVGLEAMAAGGLVFVGSTGEDYAHPFRNAVVLETDDPGEIVHYWQAIEAAGDDASIRAAARETAAQYAWPRVLRILLRRLDYLAACAPR